MPPCDAHDSFSRDMERMSNAIDNLRDKSLDHESRLVAVEERGERRASDVQRLESVVERLERMVISLQNAPARKLETRWDSLIDKGLWLIASAVIAIFGSIIMHGGKP